jgi:hypothetical protein
VCSFSISAITNAKHLAALNRTSSFISPFWRQKGIAWLNQISALGFIRQGWNQGVSRLACLSGESTDNFDSKFIHLFVLLQQTTTEWVIYKENLIYFSQFLRLRSPKSRGQHLMRTFLLCLNMVEDEKVRKKEREGG